MTYGRSKTRTRKKELLNNIAKEFLLENNFIEEALDGTTFCKVSSDDSVVYKNATNYYKNNNLLQYFSLVEFRDEIKKILDESFLSDPFEYDLDRLD